MKTTIILEQNAVELLKKAKENPRQTYNEIITKMSKMFIAIKERNQYDEFLHKIQQPKMNELWNNKEDEIWDAV